MQWDLRSLVALLVDPLTAWIIVIIGLLITLGGFGGKVTIKLPGLTLVGAAGAIILIIGVLALVGVL